MSVDHSMMMTASMQSSARQERGRKYGFDCSDNIEWKGWDAGGEYIRKLTLKNISKKMQTIKYKLPVTKYFGMEFPIAMKVGPGMSYVVEVIFRPIKLERYDDFIEFQTDLDTFQIPIRAVLLQKSFYTEDAFEFGFCPTMEISEGAFDIVNNGELPLDFSWSISEPFSLSPPMGTLAPGTSCRITPAFHPREATVFINVATCRVEGLEAHTMKLTGVGKFAHIALDGPADLDFGEVQTDDSAERTFELRNDSLVNTVFNIVPLGSEDADIFEFSPKTGSIAMEDSTTITVRYKARATGTFSAERFEIQTPGGNVVPLECKGTAVGPAIHFSSCSLNFGDVKTESVVKRVLRISNGSTMAASFQVLADAHGVFGFDRVQGTVPAEMYPGKAGYIEIVISFSPLEPCNYYKRVFVLLKNQAPQFVDVLGTCFSDKQRPAPFSQRHIDAYRDRAIAGHALAAPDDLPGLAAELGTDALGETRELMIREDEIWDEIFLDYSDRKRPVYVEEEALDFGSCSSFRMGENKTITVVNRAKGKVTCCWMPNTHYAIFPESADIKPNGGTYSFQVSFRPHQENDYYCSTVEAFVYYKTMRNFRLITDETFVPPWHVQVSVHGHTFAPGAEHFLPKVSLPGGGDTVHFSACALRESQYQTLALTNVAHTPLFFDINLSDTNNAFSCKPMQALVSRASLQLVALRFSPSTPKSYQSSVSAVLNHTPHHSVDFPVAGSAFLPGLHLPNSASVFFKPTCIGAAAERLYKVTNPSRLTLEFEWDIPPALQGIFAIFPRQGVIRGNEDVQLSCVFTPTKMKQYNFRVACSLCAPGHAGASTKVWLNVTARGSVGAVSFFPHTLDFSDVAIGEVTKKKLRLTNNSECAMHWVLVTEPTDKDSGDDQELQQQKEDAYILEARSGVLTAGSYRDLKIELRPTVHAAHNFTLSCQYSLGDAPLSGDTLVAASEAEAALPSCRLMGRGALPTLQVSDVWCGGLEGVCAPRVVWEQYTVDQMNECLRNELSEAEIEHNDPEAELKNMQDYIASLDQFPMQFSTREVFAPDSHITLQFTNTGGLPLDWKIKYPDDLGIDPEHWAEAEAPTAQIVKQGFVIDNNIFSAHPHAGHVEAGDTQTITFSYRYVDNTYDEGHLLNLILQITNGKQVVLQLTGRTAKPEAKLLQMKEVMELTPVMIGASATPTQCIEIHNVGMEDVRFHLDLSPVEKLCEANFNFPVLTCTDPAGMVGPGRTALVRWAFNPLEDKRYDVEVPLTVVGGPSYMIKLGGRGYHPDHIHVSDVLAERAATVEPATIPARQTMLDEQQLVRLSSYNVHFDTVPVHSVCRRLVVVENTCVHPIRFEWDMRQPRYAKVFDVQPAAGQLMPGERLLCRVRMRAVMPEAFSFDGVCRVYDEAEEEEYEAALRELQRLQEEADDADEIGGAGATKPPRRRRSKKKRRAGVVATSTLQAPPKILFGKSQTGAVGFATTARAGQSGRTLGTSRSYVSTQSGQGSLASTRGGTSVAGTNRTMSTFAPVEEAQPPMPPQPYVSWLTVHGMAVALDDTAMHSENFSTQFIAKKSQGGVGAMDVMDSQRAGLPALQGVRPLSPSASAPEEEPARGAPDAEALGAIESALMAMLSDLTSDADVSRVLEGVGSLATPYYSALVGDTDSNASSKPSSPEPPDVPKLPLSPIAAPRGEAEEVITARGSSSGGGMDTPGAAPRADGGLGASPGWSPAAGEVDLLTDGGTPGGELNMPRIHESQSHDSGVGRATPTAAEPAAGLSAERRVGLIGDPMVEALLEFTLEEALFNLMSEVVHGDFDLSAAPRLIVQNCTVEAQLQEEEEEEEEPLPPMAEEEPEPEEPEEGTAPEPAAPGTAPGTAKSTARSAGTAPGTASASAS